MTTIQRPDADNPADRKVLVVIPARLESSRLAEKVLADIAGAPMIVQVWRRAVEAGIGPVVVASGHPRITDAVRAAGGQAVETDPDLPSGSDRVWQAVKAVDPDGAYPVIVNVQGDLPTLDPHLIVEAVRALEDLDADIGTLLAEIAHEAERTNPNVVKCAAGFAPGADVARALYFSRATIPFGPGPHYHHIGLYAYRRAALERFVALPPGVLETREKLEQLRALEAGMRIAAARVDTVPLGVDTADDLERARQIMGGS